MEVKCPACGTTDVRRMSDLWRKLSSGEPPAGEVLAAGLAQASIGARAAHALPPEHQLSLLRDELAPPRKLADLPAGGSCRQMSAGILLMLGGLAAVVVGIVRLAAKHLATGRVVTTILGSLVLAAAGYAIVRIGAPKATFKQYDERLATWSCTYLCLKCGNRFAQDA